MMTDLTGVGSVYEEPEQPDLTVDTMSMSVRVAIAAIVDQLQRRGVFRRN